MNSLTTKSATSLQIQYVIFVYISKLSTIQTIIHLMDSEFVIKYNICCIKLVSGNTIICRLIKIFVNFLSQKVVFFLNLSAIVHPVHDRYAELT